MYNSCLLDIEFPFYAVFEYEDLEINFNFHPSIAAISSRLP